jgi:hypothetical protein
MKTHRYWLGILAIACITVISPHPRSWAQTGAANLPLANVPSTIASNSDGSKVVLGDATLLDPQTYSLVSWSDVASIRPAATIDSITYVGGTRSAGGNGPATYDRFVTAGAPCAKVDNEHRCFRALANARKAMTEFRWVDEFHMQYNLGFRFLVGTKGDRMVMDPRAMFGTIDSPVEAAWLFRATEIRTDGSGFLALVTHVINDCPWTTEPIVYSMDPNGAVSERTRGLIETKNVCT